MNVTIFKPSYLKDCYAKESVPMDMRQVYEMTKGNAWLKEQTARFRDTGDESVKNSMPRITPVQLNGSGKTAADVAQYIGLVPCDLDRLPAERMDEVRDRLSADQHVLFCAESISRRGFHVYGAYRVAQDCAMTDEAAFQQAFYDFNDYVSQLADHPYDEQLSSPVHTLSLSYDPQVYYNPDAVPFVVRDVDADFDSDIDDDFSDYIAPEMPHTEEMSLVQNGSTVQNGSKLNAEGIEREASNQFKQSQTKPNGRWVKVPKDKIRATEEFAQKRGMQYMEHNRHNYMVFCVFHMNKLGVPRSEAERWLAQFSDRKELEKRSILKSIYDRHSQDFGTYEEPYEWVFEPMASKTMTRTGQNFQTFNSSNASHAHTREGEAEVDELEKFEQAKAVSKFHPFPDYEYPTRIMQTLECTDSKAQRDMMLLAVITVLGAMIGRLLRFKYSHRFWYPALQTFAVGTAASGKSAITLARRLSDPLVKRLERIYDQAKRQYEKEKAAYDCAGKEKANMELPEPPKMKLFQLAGNTTASAVIEHLDENDGHALMCESEADTISQMTNTESGGSWSDILRKAHDHDQILMTRRTNRERRKVENPCLSVLISGTPAQVKPLINSAENGQFSREIFLQLPAIDEFIDQFDDEETDFDSRFYKWGEEWLQELDRLKGEVSCIELKLTAQQREEFNAQFSQLFHHAASTQADHHMKSSVAREAINVLRMMSVVALLRALETGAGLAVPDDVPKENVQDGIIGRYDLSVTDDDFHAVVALAEPLYRNACDVLALLPSTEFVRQQQSPMEQFAASLPLRFSRAEAIETGAQMGLAKATVDTYINRLKAQRQLQNVERGIYAFTNAVGSRVCVCKSTPES